MTASRERMLEYLYDELAGEERAAFESQLAASEADRRELAALQATLRETRALLASDPPPPARVRASVLAAAQAQLKAAAPQPAIADVTQLRIRRWLRATWIVPSLAVAAAALLMINQRSAQQLERDVAAKSQTVEGDSPAAPVSQPTAVEVERPAAAKGERADQPEPSNRADESARARRPPASSAGSARAARGGAVRRAPDPDGFAKPPPGWNADAPAPAKSRAPQLEAEMRAPDRERSAPDDLLEGLGAAEAAPPAAAGVARDRQEAAPMKAARAASERPALSPFAERPDLSLVELERRAREHAVARRVSLAVADYRELLRRYPQHARVSVWRTELARLTRTQGDAAVGPPAAR